GTGAPETLDMKQLITVFNNKWVPFRFVLDLPENSDLPIVLAGGQCEQLSIPDRAKLSYRKTICFERAGVTTERYKKTDPWYLTIAGLKKKDYQKKYFHLNLFNGESGSEKHSMLPSEKIISSPNDDVTFVLPPKKNSKLVNLTCIGQAIEVPVNAYTSVDFLIASDKGNLAEKVVLNYVDGSSESRYLGLTVNDRLYKPFFGKPGWSGKENKDGPIIYLSHISVPCSPAKTLKSIALPNENKLHVYAITMGEGGLARDVEVSLQLDGKEVKGKSAWVLAIRNFSTEELAKAPFRILYRFTNGRPAIIQSVDGMHVTFLYDALAWSYEETEISTQVEEHAKILKKILSGFKQNTGGMK
ncbi:MAG: hypothetical protein P9M03_09045, partial [Candidatus Theseobacter exili]|nr:hypothetical protein [Candidatus Theseobacter exili]